MRCMPRRRKQLWIFFLLFVCLIGVYLSYKHLSDGKKQWYGQTSLPYNPQLEKTHKQLREKTRAEIERAKAEARLGTKPFKGLPNINKNGLHIDGNAALVGMRMLENDDDYITQDERMARLKLLLIDLNPTNWKTTPDVEDMVLQLKSELFDLNIDSKMSCKEINSLKTGGLRYRSHFGKKSVEHMSKDYFNSVMVKSPGKDTTLKIQCMQMDYNEQRCSVMQNYKMMRELVYLLVLDSPSIIKLKGFCLRGETIDPRVSRKGVVIVTEAGEELNMASVMHFPRQTKLEISEALLKFLLYMDNSPVGSLGFDKLHSQDFVIFGTELKLVDLDNIHIGEISCMVDSDCTIPEMSRKGFDKLHSQDFVIFGTDLKLVDLDNIHIGEIACMVDSDCTIPEMSRKEIKCQNNVCKGRNMYNNFLWFNRILLKDVLLPAPRKYEYEVSRALTQVQNLEISVQQLLDKVKVWKEDRDPMINVDMGRFRENDVHTLGEKDFHNGIPPKDPHKEDFERYPEGNRNSRLEDMGSDRLRKQNALDAINEEANHDNKYFGDKFFGEMGSNRRATPEPKSRDENDGLVEVRDPNSKLNDEPEEYIRENHANYPGLYDYVCSKSRVNWGCVVTIRSIDEAKTVCNSDPRCHSFVIFSADPDIAVVMTAIFKNSAKGRPDHNHGATLFSKKRHREKTSNLQGNLDLQEQGQGQYKVAMETVKPSPPVDVQACARKVLNQTDLGRISREKRLMTHLGMKGISEQEWISFAQSVKIVRSQGLSQMSHKLVNGGRLKVVYDTNGLGLKKGEFLLEKGPSHHHISFMIAYHLDRTLGLYHIPPVASKVLSKFDVHAITGDKKFQELYARYNESDVLHGALTVAVPPVMKTESITLSNQEAMVTSIHPFTRTEKSQLEYILIWSLMKFLQPSHGFLGYKGHLIHFEADSGFGNMKKYMQGYFYNCQFPNSVFKTLLCYKCSSHKLPKICGLGNEVMKHVKLSGFSSQDIQIGKYKEKHLADIIDHNAASVLSVVEHCIKSFSREKVLY